MDKIEVCVLNPEAVGTSEKMMVCAVRLTQKGHKIKDLEDFIELYNKAYTENTVAAMAKLPHPTIQKFGVINVVIVGASRRFLAQITRHQNEVKFMSASLQYSDYSGEADFVVPYKMLEMPALVKRMYLHQYKEAMDNYQAAIAQSVDNDSAGYMVSQSLRNILIISATPYQWKHMIGQRTCRRNTSETRYVLLRIWEKLYRLSPEMFAPFVTGPFCMKGHCMEGKMSYGNTLDPAMTPAKIIKEDFPLLAGGASDD